MPVKMLKQDPQGQAHPFTQLLVFLFITVVCAFVFSLLGAIPLYIIGGWDADMTESPDILRWAQLISSIGLFLVPALFYAWLTGDDIRDFLSIRERPKIPFLFWALIGLFLLAPSIALAEYLNRQMTFPEILAPVETWMRAQEDKAEQMTLLLLEQKGVVTLLFNLLVIAVGAGITEEFYFRGALQRIIARWSGNPHVVIWVTAIIFSAFHLQFYGFLPRMLLGAYFGYLLLWTGSLWVPVFAHFANNAISVIGMSNQSISENPYFTSELPTTALYFYIPMALLGLFFLWRTRKKMQNNHFREGSDTVGRPGDADA
ncbi:membrane protease YdiL (CAAX protease family) [Parabacteroides sp. PFB2-12]|uniref:CPBP family intramembrane glutamic endopeptidase n=1 Tax=unclassified Parabacteroides TaxID=2649774 RepID=UPI0024768089|nr:MULTISPECIES: type II CAAX endopeptidase family protein [unclassified Parabacteroides]MDH6342276.1 membrane protease YdiL (CAAX protease family) [Parabacteroides sp. PM6-13]MDH6390619.1 membrane protease YdiL (CAAX protease family) [Parabacteroides sp. PFB2-12]MDL2310000.1 CPBP family intramembrane metalloprotease [Parabacteroides sp. OttesenSCG-928-B22]